MLFNHIIKCEENTVLSNQMRSMPYYGALYDQYQPVVIDGIGASKYDAKLLQHNISDGDIKTFLLSQACDANLINYDVKSLQHEVPDVDMKTWTLTQFEGCDTTKCCPDLINYGVKSLQYEVLDVDMKSCTLTQFEGHDTTKLCPAELSVKLSQDFSNYDVTFLPTKDPDVEMKTFKLSLSKECHANNYYPPNLLLNERQDLKKYDAKFLQSNVPDVDIKTLVSQSEGCDSKKHCPASILLNPKALHFYAEQDYIAGFNEITDCRNTVEDTNLKASKIISEKCVENDNFEKVKEMIEYAFNECPNKCIGGHFKCEEIKRHVEQKVCSSQPVDNSFNEENLLRMVVFFHSLRCKYSTNCKIPKCVSIKMHLENRYIVNKKTEPLFKSNEQLRITFSNVNTFSVNTSLRINHDLISVFEKNINEGNFGKVYDCWIYFNNGMKARVAVKKVKEAESIKATAKSMALLSTISESTNIVIPLLVLETANNPKICYQIMTLAEMDLKFVVNNGPITENLISYLIKDILIGLWYLHSSGYVHSDLKLENIVLKDYSALICDIDFVKEENAICEVETPNFSAPEIYDGVANKPIDIHSVGLIIASMANVDISTKINLDDLPKEKKRKIIERNKIVLNKIKRTHYKFSNVFHDCTKEDPSKRPTVDHLVNNSLFKVDVETVSNEINCIRSKKSSEIKDFEIQDDLANSIVQLHLNQILDKLPKKFLENEHFYHGNCVNLEKCKRKLQYKP